MNDEQDRKNLSHFLNRIIPRQEKLGAKNFARSTPLEHHSFHSLSSFIKLLEKWKEVEKLVEDGRLGQALVKCNRLVFSLAEKGLNVPLEILQIREHLKHSNTETCKQLIYTFNHALPEKSKFTRERQA